MYMAKCLMVQGTTSDAGKSAIATGLCRLLRRQGYKVAPFKPQNMALNSAVTIDGGEIGRAQAVQAKACGIEPHTDMNPVLLKPNSDIGAQVIVCGKARADMNAMEYHQYKPQLFGEVIAAYQRLAGQYDVIIVEGAGSPAEINLRDNDIANMGFATALNCPVILVADIERGGVFAHLVGTLDLLQPSERDLVKGMIINRFRGDINILQPGIDWLETRVKIPVLATLPYLKDLYLEAEDSLSGFGSHSALLSGNKQSASTTANFRVIVPRLPRISNHTDFDPLILHPQVDFSFISEGESIVPSDLVVLPGSKSVISDLHWLREQGWEEAINTHLRYGGKVIGICGGFQMLGEVIRDPRGIEGKPGSASGLGLLAIQSILEPEKQLRQVRGKLFKDEATVTGYEIHAGITTGNALESPAIKIGNRFDGAVSHDQQLMGTYLHGLFDAPEALTAIMDWAGATDHNPIDVVALQEAGIDLLADVLEQHLDQKVLQAILGFQ